MSDLWAKISKSVAVIDLSDSPDFWVPVYETAVSGIVSAACKKAGCVHRHCVARALHLNVLAEISRGTVVDRLDLLRRLGGRDEPQHEFSWPAALEFASWAGLIRPTDYRRKEFKLVGPGGASKSAGLTQDDASSHIFTRRFADLERALVNEIGDVSDFAFIGRAILSVIQNESEQKEVRVYRRSLDWLEECEWGLRDRLFLAMGAIGMTTIKSASLAVLNAAGPLVKEEDRFERRGAPTPNLPKGFA